MSCCNSVKIAAGCRGAQLFASWGLVISTAKANFAAFLEIISLETRCVGALVTAILRRWKLVAFYLFLTDSFVFPS